MLILDNDDGFLEHLGKSNSRYICTFTGSGPGREKALIQDYEDMFVIRQTGYVSPEEAGCFIHTGNGDGVTHRMPYKIQAAAGKKPGTTIVEIRVSDIPNQARMTEIDAIVRNYTQKIGGKFDNQTRSASIGS